MFVIRTRNVHQALPQGLAYLASYGIPSPSRNGGVLVAPGPVTTIYNNPQERVIFWPERDASPLFHFFEALWMLAGRNDLAFIEQFVKRFKNYSDDGETLAAAYGHRWRVHFGFDQIQRVIALLKNNPNSRRAVIAMWDPRVDLHETEDGYADIPCNDLIDFKVSFGKRDEPNRLNMTLYCRSHDIIWGAYGANAVHFSFLHEYVATHLGLVIGNMTTISSNYHAYLDVFEKTRQGSLLLAGHNAPPANPYATGDAAPYPLIQNPATWDRDLALFFEAPNSYGFDNPFFSQVAKPLWFAFEAHKRHAYVNALEIVAQCAATDWRRAAEEWLRRRQAAWQTKRRSELAAERERMV